MSDHLASIFGAFIILLLGYLIHDVKQEFRSVRQEMAALRESLRQEIAATRDLLTGKVIDHEGRISKLEK
jgi:hypothetical protein